MKKGDLVNMYNTHNLDGTPDEKTLCSKGVLVKPYNYKSDGWEEFECWTIDVFWDRLSNPPKCQEVWFVHPNDIIKGEEKHWLWWAIEMKKASEKLIKVLKNSELIEG